MLFTQDTKSSSKTATEANIKILAFKIVRRSIFLVALNIGKTYKLKFCFVLFIEKEEGGEYRGRKKKILRD